MVQQGLSPSTMMDDDMDEEDEQEEEEEAVAVLFGGGDDGDGPLLQALLSVPSIKTMLDHHNSYRSFTEHKSWERLKQEFPTTEDWKATFRFSLE